VPVAESLTFEHVPGGREQALEDADA